jgi:5'-nucleotidase
MNILLTNDDGINSEGLQKLADVLRSRLGCRVFVIAPDTDRSGVSHAISIIKGPVKLRVMGEGADSGAWSCSGSPADCVFAGIKGALPVKPDLVLSGINRGANLGTDLIYSGTAAAARQASLMGVPGIALSLAGDGNYRWEMAALWIADHLDELKSYMGKDAYVNVNIPNTPEGPKGMIAAWPAVKCYNDTMTVTADLDGAFLCTLRSGQETTVKEPGSDCDVVSRNYVSVSAVANHPAVLGELCPGAPARATVTAR